MTSEVNKSQPNPKEASPVSETPQTETPKGRKLEVKDLLLTFLTPTIFGKMLVLYFGIKYSAEPDRGYGVWLIISILFTLTMIGRFLWRYRHYDDS